MSYSDFTMTRLNEQFGLDDKKMRLFPADTLSGLVQPRARLLEDIADAKEIPIESEKSKSEHLITPLLKEVWHLSNKKFVYYSGYSFEVNKQEGLSGVCDYLLSKEEGIEIKAPVFCLVEAKHRTIAEGIPQAFAEMYAAQIFNQKHKKAISSIFGCVTDGTNWRFLKLEQKNAYIDTQIYHIEHDLCYLLEILVKIATA